MHFLKGRNSMKKRLGFLAAGAVALGFVASAFVPAVAEAQSEAAPIEKYSVICYQAPGGGTIPITQETAHGIGCTAPQVGSDAVVLNPATDFLLTYRKPKGANVNVLVHFNAVCGDLCPGFPLPIGPPGVGLPCVSQFTQGTGNQSQTPGPGLAFDPLYCLGLGSFLTPEGQGIYFPLGSCVQFCILHGKYVIKTRGFDILGQNLFAQVGKSGPVKVKVKG
jgi:hypothetical protein